MKNKSGIQQIRNATVIIHYAGKKILVDPMLAPKGAFPGFEGTVNSHLRNPLVELPISIKEIVDVDAVILTHVHPDHWDDEATKNIAKNKLIFSQNEKEKAFLESAGFTNVTVVEDRVYWEGIEVIKTPGLHGTPEVVEAVDLLDDVCGFVFKNKDEKTIYLAGDTVWNEDVKNNINSYGPDVIILNAGGAVVGDLPPIIMDEKDVERVLDYSKEAQIITTHHEAVNHCLTTRSSLESFLKERGKEERVKSPVDGTFVFF
ncbi:MBL fold metallo-hydrolase [Halobacteriovorax sp. GB3]|uniref:MBL fold metallo-hydrolase n=1 Tax=Halobacteriovorax sp. GB3 TaxID=2719615 RepID=UPI0023626ECB|nr:MBL fold metallo-hydrolase [Halobacteriovorax sp. GB3]MDD0851635.1 MBL fold metallo-hydrolase [Halobacteriovorax sp. GB3]